MKFQSNSLAINGGTPVRSKRWIDNITTGEEEKEAVIRTIESGYLSLFEGSHTPDKPFSFVGGPEVTALEAEWNEYYGTLFSVAVNSATSGLYAAIGALGIGYGDEVIVSPYTMTACALSPLIYGAIPVFADIDANTGCMDPKSIKSRISKNTKAIVVVHQFGFPADMDEIISIANENNIKIIEDCAQAHSAKYKDKFVGTFGDIGVFSLNVNKTIQAGEGGICVTNNPEIAYRLQLIRNHGEAVVGPANYKNITNILGFNYRMTEICAAIAREQLKKLNFLTEKRLSMVNKFKELLSKVDCLYPLEYKYNNDSYLCECQPTFYIVPFVYEAKGSNIKRERIVEILNAEGLLLYQGYTKPLYLQPIYQQKTAFKNGYPFTAKENLNLNQNYKKGICPIAEELYFNKLILSEHIRPPQNLSDIDDIGKIFAKVFEIET